MLHVAIRERKITCLIVPVRRKVPPDILHEIGRISWWIAELGVEDSLIVLIYENEEAGWGPDA